MAVIGSKQDLQNKLATQEQIIEAARNAASGWISFYIKERLAELEKMYPGHKFIYSHPVYGGGITVTPALYGQTDLDDLEGDVATCAVEITNDLLLLAQIVNEVSDLATDAEDKFKRTLGRITTEDEEEKEPVSG